MQSILVDFVGQENFAYHLAEGFPEIFALQEALTDKLVENCRMIAAQKFQGFQGLTINWNLK